MTQAANKTDLHIHSTFSDGSYTPAGIIGLAAGLEMDAIALTDHDTISGIEDALRAAGGLRRPIAFIPGVEISATYKCSLHIIGYFRPDNYRNIGEFIDIMNRERDIRNLGIIDRLNGLGVDITAEEVAEIAGKKVFGRPHIAAVLVRRGFVPTLASAFNEYLSGGRKAYVGKRSLPPGECVAAIAEAGGLPVIAHPSQTGLRLRELAELAKALTANGLYGLEAYYSEHTKTETEKYLKLAGDLGLQATGGSDFHGDYRKHVKLGSGRDNNLFIPDGVADKLLSALRLR